MFKNFLKSRAQKSRRAITLIEVLLSIAIGVGIIITAVLMYYSVFGSNKISEAMNEANSISSGIRNLYSAQSGYGTADITQVAVDAKIIENKYLEGNSVVNPWGGDVTIAGAGRTFTITFDGVPQEACAKLISMNSTGFGGATKSVEVNGTDIGQNITPAAATAACDEDDNNEIVWEMR